jgi:hypothetical protein
MALMAALAAAAVLTAGCSKTEREVSQSIMPAALNYYVLTQETARLRAEVKTLPAERLDQPLAKYRDIISRGQQMHAELAQMGDMKKHQDFLAAMDSSLVTQLLFLQYEAQAVGAVAENHRANAEIDRIQRQISGNTLAQARHQAELDQLSEKSQSSFRLLESLKPQLQALSRKNLDQMRLYNQMVLERKILTYTAGEDLLALLAWEQARAPAKAPPKKTTVKKTASKKSDKKTKRTGR